MSAPPGYKRFQCPGVPSDDASTCTALEGKPAGYKRRKRDEHSPPRMAIQMGKPKVCQVCYRPKRGHVDYVCATCLKDWNGLAQLEKEIAAVFPASAQLTTPQIFRKIWERHEAMRKRLKAMSARLVSGRVGIR